VLPVAVDRRSLSRFTAGARREIAGSFLSDAGWRGEFRTELDFQASGSAERLGRKRPADGMFITQYDGFNQNYGISAI
jgi:hypothetical protein